LRYHRWTIDFDISNEKRVLGSLKFEFLTVRCSVTPAFKSLVLWYSLNMKNPRNPNRAPTSTNTPITTPATPPAQSFKKKENSSNEDKFGKRTN